MLCTLIVELKAYLKAQLTVIIKELKWVAAFYFILYFYGRLKVKKKMVLRAGVGAPGWLVFLFIPNVVKAVDETPNNTINTANSIVSGPHCRNLSSGLCCILPNSK